MPYKVKFTSKTASFIRTFEADDIREVRRKANAIRNQMRMDTFEIMEDVENEG
jgi:hypothetical protein